jgi:hypothetical protein
MSDDRRKGYRGRRIMDPDERAKYARAAREESRLRVERALELLGTADGWREYVATCGRLHYSWRNCAVIAYQCPGATYLASYRRWQAEGFTVREGAGAIRITALVPGKGFRELPLFDVSQCDGDRDQLDWAAADRAESIADYLAGEIPAPIGADREETIRLAKVANDRAKALAADAGAEEVAA